MDRIEIWPHILRQIDMQQHIDMMDIEAHPRLLLETLSPKRHLAQQDQETRIHRHTVADNLRI